MGTIVLRMFLVLLCSTGGYYVAYDFLGSTYLAMWGFVAGLALSFLALFLEQRIVKHPLRAIVGGCIGLIAGLVVANLFSYVFLLGILGKGIPALLIYILMNCILGYMGLKVGSKKGGEFQVADITRQKGQPTEENLKILDTSVIIDGRIADICEIGFIEGTFILPQFILQELQHVADSSDSIRRTRGRRGLDILNKMQKQVDLNVRIVDNDFPRIREVDSKLVALAKKMNGKIVTNDFNLNKVAELQGVSVLNINQLANALKPVVLPGEVMSIRILKEGKEPGQGVAYLDDGTMVVVDNARKHMGQDVDVAVTSVLQTTAGRMIFSVLKDDAPDGLHSLRY